MKTPELLTLPPAAFTDLVRQALEACRVGDWPTLGASPLAASALVVDCFLAGEAQTPNARGRALQAVLRWAVDKFKPEGPPQWGAYAWRTYHILHSLYLAGMRVAELAPKLGVVEGTVYELRPTALEAVAQVLSQELAHPQELPARQHSYLAGRYAALGPAAQKLLRWAAIFRAPVPWAWLEVAGAEALATATTTGLLQSNPERTEAQAHPQARPYLLTLLTAAERAAWHAQAAKHYTAAQNYLEAAFHWRQAGHPQTAAALLIAHHPTITNSLQMEALRALLTAFRAPEVAPDVWAQLKLLAGELAEKMQALDVALEEYGKALGAEALAVQAEAYYRRAKILRLKNPDEALAHYKHCITRLEAAGSHPQLLAQAYIGEAWIFFDQRPNHAQALANLQRAQTLLAPTDRAGWAQLHNAWGELAFHQGHPEEAIAHHLESWLAATALQEVAAMLRAAHNLGRLYTDTGRPQQGLEYLHKSLTLAQQAGDRRIEGVSYDALGACYFFLQNYPAALTHYQQARAIFLEMGNQDWQIANAYNLVEVLLALGDLPAARRYFAEGAQMAQTMQHTRYAKGFAALAQDHPTLLQTPPSLSERQQKILAFLQTHPTLSSAECATLLQVSKEQAIRELNTLVEQQVLQRMGKARATHYTLAQALVP